MDKADSYKILIVDDISENIALLSEILTQEGYQIAASKEGKKALKIAQHNLPDLICHL